MRHTDKYIVYYAARAAHTKIYIAQRTNTKTNTGYKNNEKLHKSVTTKTAKIIEIIIINLQFDHCNE